MKRCELIVAYSAIALTNVTVLFSISFPVIDQNLALTLLFGAALISVVLMILED